MDGFSYAVLKNMCRHSQTDIFANFTAQNETLVKAYMVYRFTIISDEVEDFMREIQIDSEATFFDLHIAILKSVKYPDDQMTAFFLCSDKWERETEVALEDIGTSSDEDCWVMSETKLDELLDNPPDPVTKFATISEKPDPNEVKPFTDEEMDHFIRCSMLLSNQKDANKMRLIIRVHDPRFTEGEDANEIDVGQLSVQTLHALRDYVMQRLNDLGITPPK